MDNCPLHKLSAELRNTIWDYALRHSEPINLDSDGLPTHRKDIDPALVWDTVTIPTIKRSTDLRIHETLALTLTCKSIRSEAIATFYAVNTFVIYSEMGEKDVRPPVIFKRFQDRLRQDRRFIADMRPTVEINALWGFRLECANFCRGYIALRDDHDDAVILQKNMRELATRGLREAMELRDMVPDGDVTFSLGLRGIVRVDLGDAKESWRGFVEVLKEEQKESKAKNEFFIGIAAEAVREAGECVFGGGE